MALLCSCHRVSDREIVDHVEAGACSLSAVQEACGAGTRCGGCVPSIEDVVERLLSRLVGAGAS
jgi:nitrite reductase (NADH) large subunit